MSSNSQQSVGKSTERAMLEAVLNGDVADWDRASGVLGGARAYELMTTATSAAVFRRFPNDPSRDAIAEYVSGIYAKARTPLSIAAALVEAVIRAAFGEVELLDEISAKDILPVEIFIVQTISQEVINTSESRLHYLDEVLEAAG
jgi:hypothetical protein